MLAKRAALALVAFSIGSGLGPAAAEKVVLQLRWDHQFQFAGYYAAKWLGYYDEAGLTVEIRSAFGPDKNFRDVTGEVAEGRADFGTAGPDILTAQDKGAPLVIVNSIYQQSPVAFYSRTESNIHGPGDLIGVRVGVQPDGVAAAELRAMLRAESIDPSRVPLRPIRGALGIEDISDGLLDVAAGFTISAGWYAGQHGLNLTALRPVGYGVDFYGDTLFASRALVDKNPDLVQRFAAASLKGWEYALTHATEIADRISRDMPRGVPIRDVEGFNRFQAGQIARLIQYPVVQLGHTNPLRWRKMHAALKDAGLVSGDFDADTAIFDPDRLRESRFERRVLVASVALAVLLALAAVAWLFMLRRNVRMRHRMQDDLRRSEEHLRAITDNSPSLIYLTDIDSKVLRVNKSFERFHGVRRPEPGVGIDRPRDDAATARKQREAHRKVVADGMPVEIEYESIDADGQSHYMREITFPVLDSDGAVVAVGGSATDNTERKRAEDELERQRTFLESLVNNLPAMITMKDADGRLLFVNDLVCENSGKSRSEMLGRNALEVFDVAEGGDFAGHQRTAMRTGQPILGVEKPSEILKDRIVATSFVPIRDSDGVPYRMLTIAFDVTQLHERDRQLRQAQKMEAVGQLTGGVAHDFNNLLTVILGNLELVAEESGGNGSILKYAGNALSAAQRGAELTHRLLAFSRKQALVPINVDALQLVEGLIQLMRRTLGETIEIEVVGGDDLWHCEIDPAQLESAILNLAINARDAMPEGGTLTIEVKNAYLDDDYSAAQADVAPGRYVVVSVTDIGTGISPDQIAHVFEPFFTTKEVGKGSGLGLSMVYGFVKQSGGHVTIYSEVGVGTAVKMYLPKSESGVDTAAPEPVKSEPRSHGETILLVEDDPDVRLLVVALLSDLGYEIVEARNAQSALATLDTNSRIDMLLTDVVLPGGMSGPELADKIARSQPGLAVLFMSGYSDDAIIHQGRLDKGVDLLNKPFRKADLARKVRSVLDKAHGR